jgi:hypothetical protein
MNMLGCRPTIVLLGLASLPTLSFGQNVPSDALPKSFQHKYYDDSINDPYQ